MNSFQFSTTPELHFGQGKLFALPGLLKTFGHRVLIVAGAGTLERSNHAIRLMEELRKDAFSIMIATLNAEPSPAYIDRVVSNNIEFDPQVVVAIGGGSVLDAGKAISAMLPLRESVRIYLESVGTKTHPGTKVPFIAVPTTSGTGSEATKNAVLSEVGAEGFKKSLRHSNFVPDMAIVDPALTVTCTPFITATSGMDAFTQLLESYLSTSANAYTDPLAFEGLRLVQRSLVDAYHDGTNTQARSAMALAAYFSGITLANAGLGLVHGFASPIGGYFLIPHGVVCSTLMHAANEVTVRKLRMTDGLLALSKYGEVGRLFCAENDRSSDFYVDALLDHIAALQHELAIPKLSAYGISSNDFMKIIGAADNKNNPARLDKDEMWEVLEKSL